MKKKLILIDGNSLLFRAYYATAYGGQQIMTNKEGVPTNAIFAFSGMINKILGSLKPEDSIMVAWDADSHTFRKNEYEAYKANRPKCPEELVTQMPLAREFLSALNIYHFELHGYEADDIIGTIAEKAEKEGFETVIYTSDHDYLQLATEKTTIAMIKRGLSDIEMMTPEAIWNKDGLEPWQVVDYKGLCGDSSDNLPGIKGIGKVTATKLIQKYHDFPSIIKAAETATTTVAKKINEFKEDGWISYRLALINRTVPIEFSLDELKYEGYDFKAINSFAQHYELRQFMNRLPTTLKKLDPLTDDVTINDIKNIQGLDLEKGFGLALDIADTSNYYRSEVYGFLIASDNKVYYLNLKDALNDKAFLELLKNEEVEKNVYDAKTMEVSLSKYQIEINGITNDTLIAAYLLNSNLSISDPESVLAIFGVDVSGNETSDLFSDNRIVLAKVALASLNLKEKIKASLEKVEAYDLYKTVELPLSHVLGKMEIEGFPLNVQVLDEFGDEYKQNLVTLEDQIKEISGEDFNVASPKQLANVLFDKLELPHGKSRSTAIDVLNNLKDAHPIIPKIIEYRKFAKIVSTYIEGFKPYICDDGKIHAMFNQAQTTTGRLSSSNPNMQNISVRNEEGRNIRKAFFYPDDDYEILSLDYSQIELRILAHLSKCKELIDIFNANEDIHTSTAQKIFHKTDITPNERRKAKAVNFGIVYGISDWGLSEQLDIPVFEAKNIIDTFYKEFPSVGTFLNSIILDANENGYVSTLFGRRRYLEGIHSDNFHQREFAKRAAMNAPIQGTAADLIKIAMLKVDELLTKGNYKTKMVSQIHDELIFKIHKDEKVELIKKIKYEMEHVFKLDVPLIVEGGCGKTFFDA